MSVQEKNKLSSSSALVLRWSGMDIHTSRQSVSYLSMLNLSAAEELFEKCNAIWPHYSEVIKNRKYAVLRNADQCLSNNPGMRQVVVLAAGFDALSIELASCYDDLLVFDTDQDNMAIKQSLIQAAAPVLAHRVHCVHVNITESEILKARLMKSGWNPALPSLVIAEGISNYLLERDLVEIFRMFQMSGSPNHFLMEYFVQPDLINEARRDIPDNILAAVMAQFDIPSTSRYAPQALKGLAESIGCRVRNHYGMKWMEKERTGLNEFFPTDDSGWTMLSYFEAAPEIEKSADKREAAFSRTS
jgi:O-methyltransferase involved in polyketide biosynthesis